MLIGLGEKISKSSRDNIDIDLVEKLFEVGK